MANKLQHIWKEIKDTINVYRVLYAPNKKIVTKQTSEKEETSAMEIPKDLITLESFGQPYRINVTVNELPVNMEITQIAQDEVNFNRPGYPPHATVTGHEYHIVLSDGEGNVINEKFSPQGKFRGWDISNKSKFFEGKDSIYLCVFDVNEKRQKAYGRSNIGRFTHQTTAVS